MVVGYLTTTLRLKMSMRVFVRVPGPDLIAIGMVVS